MNVTTEPLPVVLFDDGNANVCNLTAYIFPVFTLFSRHCSQQHVGSLLSSVHCLAVYDGSEFIPSRKNARMKHPLQRMIQQPGFSSPYPY